MVAKAPRDEFVLVADPAAADAIHLSAPNVAVRRVPLSAAPTEAASADGNRSPADMLRLTRAVWKTEADVFFSPSVYTYFPVPPTLPTVVTIHDTIAERFPDLTLPTRRARWFWRAKVKLALWQSDLVLTVSSYSAREIAREFGMAERAIRVSGEAPSPVYAPSDSPGSIADAARQVGLPSGVTWFMYVGGFNPHKNVDAIVRAHATLARDLDPPPHLVLVGPSGRDVFHGATGTVAAAIAAAGTDHLVHAPGFVDDTVLRHLHSGALALILPSQCEGYGLPAVEAAACGCPVIATRESPLPELLAGGGLWVNPGDDPGLAAAMRTMWEDPDARAAMGREARRRASTLSWSSAADAALEALREVAE